MKKTVLIFFALVIGLNVFGQRQRQGRRNLNNIPQANQEPSKKDIAKHKQMVEDRKQEYILNFLTTLEADDFQKEIIKQNINTFFDAKMAILKTNFNHSINRHSAIKKLEDTHFVDLEALISKNDMTKIKELLKGDFDEKEVVKEKKKKRKKRKRKQKKKKARG
ncbi:MAG: hypothetical protein ACPGUH_04370 [Winogradskyella sp.]